MKLDHIGVYAEDVEALASWYQDKLDLEVIRKLEASHRPPVYFLKSEEGGVTIEILPTDEQRRGRELKEPGFSHIAVLVDDFDKSASYLESRGVSLHGVRRTSGGWKIGYFEDLEGNILELQQR